MVSRRDRVSRPGPKLKRSVRALGPLLKFSILVAKMLGFVDYKTVHKLTKWCPRTFSRECCTFAQSSRYSQPESMAEKEFFLCFRYFINGAVWTQDLSGAALREVCQSFYKWSCPVFYWFRPNRTVSTAISTVQPGLCHLYSQDQSGTKVPDLIGCIA